MGYVFFSTDTTIAQNTAGVQGHEIAQLSQSDPYIKYKELVPPNEWMTLSDGAKIPVRIWRATSQKAIILAMHGFNASRDAWEYSADNFVSHDITIYSPDQRGFGQAPLRGEWAGTNRMVQDIIEEINIIKQRNPNTPIYIMGESMGGSLLMCLATRSDAPQVNGYILLAPAVWGSKQIGVVGDVSLHFLKLVAPNWHLTGHEVPMQIVASDNNEALARLYFDPLSLRTTKVKAIYGLVQLMDQAVLSSPHIKYPTLVLYGDNDQLVPSKAMHKAWEKFPKWVRKDYVPTGYHLLLMGHSRNVVAKDIISWINDPDQLLPSGGDVATSAWMSVKGTGKVPFFLPSQIDKVVK